MTPEEMRALAIRLNEADALANGEAQGPSGVNHYLFVVRSLTPEQLEMLNKIEGPDLVQFIQQNLYEVEPKPADFPLWEAFMDAWQIYEEGVMGDLPVKLAEQCDARHCSTSEPNVWRWMLSHLPIRKDEFELLRDLLAHPDLFEVIAEGSPHGKISDDPLWPKFQELFPGKNFDALNDRLDAAFTLFETAATAQDEEWDQHI